MELTIIEKGASFDLDIATKQEGPKTFYFGAGWDNPNGPVDLDIVCVLLTGGKLAAQSDLVYFGNRSAQGVNLSEDNQTGEGEGDDEDIVINLDEVASSVTSIVIGLAAYAGADLAGAPNAHFRVCDGDNENSEQIGDVVVSDASPGDTVLTAFSLNRGDDGHWVLENIGEFLAAGQGGASIKGFAGQYQ